jgi:hypothetical protein
MPEKIIGSLSPWQTLHEQFPVSPQAEIFAEYEDALVQVGGLNFEEGEGAQATLTDHGFRLHVPNQFMPDICLPFSLVSTIEVDALLRKRVLNVRFDGDIPIHLKLPEASEQFLISHISPQRFTKGMEINSIGKLLTSGSAITEAQKKNSKRIEYDYMLENSMSAILSPLFLCGILLIFLAAAAWGMRQETFEVLWGFLGGFAFFVSIVMLHFGINREAQRISGELAFLKKQGNAAEATNTNTFEKKFSDSEGDTYWVPCYEYTFPANLAAGKAALIRTKLIGGRREKRPPHPVGNRLRIKYAPQLPALCCKENSCGPLLPIQSIGLIIFVSGLLWFGLALWGIDNLIAASAAQGEYQLSNISDWPQVAVGAAQMLQSYPGAYILSALFMFLGSLLFAVYGLILIIPPSSKKFRRTIEAKSPAVAA